MRWIAGIIISLIFIFPEAFAWQWLSNLIMNPYGLHGLGYGTCLGISISVGVLIFLYRLENRISEALDD